MKTNPRHANAAFTLIELMAVITIIVILAGLVIGGMGYVTEKQAKSKATVQIALLSKALEEYKLDMGTYPPTTDKSSASGAAGTATSSILFKYLYWDSNDDTKGVGTDVDQRIYVPDLDPLTSKQGWTVTPASAGTVISDPWGNQYCYRTATGVPSPTTGIAAPNASTQNPDFDLWSMGKDGKTIANNPSLTTPATNNFNKDDIRNF